LWALRRTDPRSIAVVRTRDGHGRVELSTFHTPVATSIAPRAPMNTPGIPRPTFVVDAVDDVLDRLPATAKAAGLTARPPPVPVPRFTISLLWEVPQETQMEHVWLRSLLEDRADPYSSSVVTTNEDGPQ
jgi:hypothetical protein